MLACHELYAVGWLGIHLVISWELDFHSLSSWKCRTHFFSSSIHKTFVHVSLSCSCVLFFILQIILGAPVTHYFDYEISCLRTSKYILDF